MYNIEGFLHGSEQVAKGLFDKIVLSCVIANQLSERISPHSYFWIV